MTAPDLNRKLILETPVRSPDGAGGFTVSWQPTGTLWSEVTSRTGREAAGVVTALSKVAYRIVVRAAPFGAPSRPRPDQRFREGDRVFQIHAVTESDADARYLVCLAQEESAT